MSSCTLFLVASVPIYCFPDRLAHWGGFHAKRFLEFARVDDERLFEFIHHFQGFPCLGNEETADGYHQLAHAANPGLDIRCLCEHADQIALRHRRLVIWHVPGLTVRFGALTQDDQRTTKIFYLGVRMRQVRAPDQLIRLAAQQRIKRAPTHGGVRSPGTEVIPAACCRDPYPPFFVCLKCCFGDLSTDSSFARVCVAGRLLRQWFAAGLAIHV